MEPDPNATAVGEITEAVVDKKLAKAAGVAAGAAVGGAAAWTGLGPFAAVPAALAKKIVEGLVGRLSSDPNTERMLAAEQVYEEKHELVRFIKKEVVADLSKLLGAKGESLDDLANENEAQFHQFITNLTDWILAELRGSKSVPFATAADVKVIPPDLDREVVLPDHLSDYLQRRLGTIKHRTRGGAEDVRKITNPRDHDTWRESIRQHEVEYEDHSEDQVLRELVVDSSQATPQKLWLIQGEPGAGKTTLVEQWVERWVAGLDTKPKDGMLLPILVRFRDLPEAYLPASGSELAELLWNHAYNGDLATRYPTLYAESRQVMFVPIWFLDGWDEARSDEYLTDGFLDRLRKLPGSTILTCRTAVLAKLRQPTKFDYHVAPNRLYTLRDLNQKEQLRFLNKRLSGYTREVGHLHRTLREHSQMRAISSSPLLLGLIADMANFEFAGGLELRLPGSRSNFYLRAIEHSWTEKLQGLGAADEDAILRDDVLLGLAGKTGLENFTIDSRALIEVMRVIPDLQIREQRERLLGFLIKSGLLKSPRTSVYEFVHLTFQEYYLARSLQRDGFEKALNEHWADPQYDETLALLVSQAVEGSQASTIEDGLIKFIMWGQDSYDSDPEYLLEQVKRSPLRVAMHLINRTGMSGRALPRLMELLAHRARKSWRRTLAVALDPNSPTDTLSRLAREGDCSLKLTVAENPNTPEEILREFSRDEDVGVQTKGRRYLLEREDTLRRLESKGPEEKRAASGKSTTSLEVIKKLANDEDEFSRICAAFLRHTPGNILAKLATDDHLEVRRVVAENPNTPKETLAELSRDKSQDVRWRVACNSNTPVKVLTELGSDCWEGDNVVCNPNLILESV